jgi:hypothetical protein
MKMKLVSVMSVFALVALFATAAMAADTLNATQTVNGDVINVTITYTGELASLGYQAFLPEDVHLTATDAANGTNVTPKAGATGTLDFVWVMPPENPVTLSYTVSGNAGAVSGQVLYRRTGGEVVEPVE